MSSEYLVKMEEARENVEKIEVFRKQMNTDGLFPKNFLVEANHNAIDIAQRFRETFGIYQQFNQRDAARELLEMLFEFVESSDEFVSSFRLHLLLSTIGVIDWLDQILDGARQKVKDHLRAGYGAKLAEIEHSFWLLTLVADRQSNSSRSVLEYLRDLSDSEEERSLIDVAILKSTELAAHFCVTRGANLDAAEMWYRHAATVAETRIGDQGVASRLLKRASEINFVSSRRLYDNPMFIKALQSEPGTQEYADAMQQLGIAENLTIILHKNLEASPLSSFLPSPPDIAAEYDNEEHKLQRLLVDPRFAVNRASIETRVAQERGGNMGFMEWVGLGQYIDLHGNPRGNYGETEKFICQYIAEVTDSVTYLLQSWQQGGYLTVEFILEQIRNSLPDYDLGILENGLRSYFDGNFIGATHTLIPQFENILREWARLKGADTKRFNRQGVPGEKLLHDFINPANTEIQTLLGNELFALIAWFMVNDGPFDYRNKIAHGWLSATECRTPHIPAMTIFLTLKVLSL